MYHRKCNMLVTESAFIPSSTKQVTGLAARRHTSLTKLFADCVYPLFIRIIRRIMISQLKGLVSN
jgi:hypothetical protein